jgi:excisionase family DNA binding protein
MPDSPDELMTVAEIAAALRLIQATIRNWIASGKLPALRLGQRRVRVKRADFDRLVAEGYTSALAAPVHGAGGIWDGEIPMPAIPPHSPCDIDGERTRERVDRPRGGDG